MMKIYALCPLWEISIKLQQFSFPHYIKFLWIMWSLLLLLVLLMEIRNFKIWLQQVRELNWKFTDTGSCLYVSSNLGLYFLWQDYSIERLLNRKKLCPTVYFFLGWVMVCSKCICVMYVNTHVPVCFLPHFTLICEDHAIECLIYFIIFIFINTYT
jgi:hypothetical protein